MIEHVIYVEKYRPSKVSECILPSKTASIAKAFVEQGNIPNLMLTGPAGTGKTTLAKALASELGYDVMMINGSNEGRLIDTLRTKIVEFASAVSFTGARKMVIIDEADYMPADTVQAAFRNICEEFAANCSFVLTCNFPNRLIEPIHSRCTVIDFTVPAEEKASMAKQMFMRVSEILNTENVEFEKAAVAEVVKRYFPDFRRTLNELQRYASTGKIDAGILTTNSGLDIDNLVAILKTKNFKEMRKWVATTPSLDINVICRKLYDGAYDYVQADSIPQLVIDLADFQYKNAFVADKEINIAAMLTTLMANLEWK